jgi:hypothetical protein
VNKYGIDFDNESDDGGASIVVQDDTAPKDEELERLPAGIVIPDAHTHENDIVRNGGYIDAVYSRLHGHRGRGVDAATLGCP